MPLAGTEIFPGFCIILKFTLKEPKRAEQTQELRQSAQTVSGYQHKQEGILALTILGDISAEGLASLGLAVAPTRIL